jgi:hypothetical protein
MCTPASFIVIKDPVSQQLTALWSAQSDSHEVILRENNIDDTSDNPQFVRCEVTPPSFDYALPLNEWQYQRDQDILPVWYDAADVEAACRAALPLWAASNVIAADAYLPICDGYVAVCLGRIGKVEGKAKIGIVEGNAEIGRVRDNAKIDVVGDDVKIGVVGDDAKIGVVGDDAKIGVVCDNAEIGIVDGNAEIGRAWGDAKIDRVMDNVKIGVVGDNAKIDIVGDDVKIMNDLRS